jgi:DNA-binding transcriptional LysR family regulator
MHVGVAYEWRRPITGNRRPAVSQSKGRDMDHLESLRVFCTVVEVRSFTRAAQVHGLSTPAVSRSISELEERLGVRLFQRSTRHISTTEVAERFFTGCARILVELDSLEAEARHGVSEPTGVLRLVAHTTATVNLLVPLISGFKKRFPAVHLDLTLTERPVDLVEDGYDLGILLPFMLTTDQMITRPLRCIHIVMVTSPLYLQTHPRPEKPEDLANLNFIAVSPANQALPLRFRRGDTETAVEMNVEISTNNSPLRKEMVLDGFGIAALPQTLIEEELRDGRLMAVLDDYEFVDSDIQLRLAYSDRKFMPAKVRAFVDYAAAFYDDGAGEAA